MSLSLSVSCVGGVSPPGLTGSLWFCPQRFIFNLLAEKSRESSEGLRGSGLCVSAAVWVLIGEVLSAECVSISVVNRPHAESFVVWPTETDWSNLCQKSHFLLSAITHRQGTMMLFYTEYLWVLSCLWITVLRSTLSVLQPEVTVSEEGAVFQEAQVSGVSWTLLVFFFF